MIFDEMSFYSGIISKSTYVSALFIGLSVCVLILIFQGEFYAPIGKIYSQNMNNMLGWC